MIVADSHSTDDTVKVATELGAKVVQIPFKGFGDLRNEALKTCSHDWILSLDSDERSTPESQKEIRAVMADKNALDLYYMPRQNIFLGRMIKHVWPYPDYRQPQLFRRGKMEYKQDAVHEGFINLGDQPIGKLKLPIIQIPYLNIDEMMRKMNRYSSLSVDRLIQKGVKPSKMKALGHAVWKFFHFYFLKAGFLDGWPGFVITIGQCEYTFLKYAKLMEHQDNCKIDVTSKARSS